VACEAGYSSTRCCVARCLVPDVPRPLHCLISPRTKHHGVVSQKNISSTPLQNPINSSQYTADHELHNRKPPQKNTALLTRYCRLFPSRQDVTYITINNYTILTHSECVFVTLGMEHAVRMRHIVIRSLSDSTIFFHIIS